MRFIGSENAHIETNVKREIKNVLRTFTNSDNKAFNPKDCVGLAVSNVICTMIMSKRFESGDPVFEGFLRNFEEGFRLYGETNCADFIPFMNLLPGISKATNQLKKNRRTMLSFVKSVVQEHRDYFTDMRQKAAMKKGVPVSSVKVADVPTRDLIDAYLQEIDAEHFEKENLFPGKEVEEQLQQVILDLFSAGVETLKTSLYWSLLFMIHNKDVVAKIQEELETVVGHHRLPDASDIKELTYTRAALCEVMRRASVVPMGTTHAPER